jgi:hypothetical protein
MVARASSAPERALELTFDISQFMLRLLGAFYAFAGYIAGRAALTSRFMDLAIAAIGATRPDPIETRRSLWLLSGSLMILAGGAALILLLDIAPWLFIASSIGQAVYLFVLAPRYFDLVDPPDERGRRQTTNAFVIYVAVTALVLWAAVTNRLTPWDEVPWPLLAAAAVTLAAYTVYLLRGFFQPLKPAGPIGDVGSRGETWSEDPAQSHSIKVMADYDSHPLWALDPGVVGNFAPEDLGLSEELARDLNEWAAAFNSFLDRDNPAESLASPQQQSAHEAQGRQLSIRLARERPDLEIYAFQSDIGVARVYAEDPL